MRAKGRQCHHNGFGPLNHLHVLQALFPKPELIDWDLGLTTQDEVDGIVQVLLAIMASVSIGDDAALKEAFAPPVLLALINEACARAA